MKTPTYDAYKLLHDGALALAEVERNGIRIDTDLLDRTSAKLSKKISAMQAELRQDPIWRQWQRHYGAKSNLGSREQLATMVFGVLKYPCHSYTPKSYNSDGTLNKDRARPQASESAFEKVDLPFVKTLIRVEKYKKAKNTFLKGIRDETVDGFLHPSFNLHTVETFRSSSDSPNFQNFPVRDVEISKLIRRCFIPRPGRVLVENDFGALEFCIAAAWWQDPAMIAYASDPTLDIHRDQAADIFCCSTKEVNKNTRYCAKNMMVFPMLYGSYYVQCAKNLWEAMERLKLTVGDVPAREWLAQRGITSLGKCDPKEKPVKGTFEFHMKQVEERFFNRFPIFAQKKEEWYKAYRKTADFRLMTGFVVSGLYSKNDLLNYPIQGPGFHCLLMTIIKLLKELKRRAMESLVVGQIHDCAIGDVVIRELQQYLRLVKKIVAVYLPKAFPWIIVPLKIEAEVCPEGGSWFAKAVWVENSKGIWEPKE